MVASSILASAGEALRNGRPVVILDAETREAECDVFFAAESMTPAAMRMLRTEAGGELYIAIGREVVEAFQLPYAGDIVEASKYHLLKKDKQMCQGTCSVGLSIDHRSLKTGAPDEERSFTCKRVVEVWKQGGTSEDFAREFHSPGHIFFCMENEKGLLARRGHTELSVALARASNVEPIMVGCVMLYKQGDNFGALSSQDARTWAHNMNVPFLTGEEIVSSSVHH